MESALCGHYPIHATSSGFLRMRRCRGMINVSMGSHGMKWQWHPRPTRTPSDAAARRWSRGFPSTPSGLPRVHRRSVLRQALLDESRSGPADELPPQPITASGKPLPESVWALKPYWCQPWSILLTGALIPSGVWLISGKSVLWATFASVPILAWWYLFLVLYPAEYTEYRKSFAQSGRTDGEGSLFE